MASDSGNDGAAAFAELQKQLNDDNNPLPLQLLVTMHRRKFLLETIVGDAQADARERDELRQAEEHAAATNNVYMLSQVRRRQRLRETAKQHRMERLQALQAVVDRNKRRQTQESYEQHVLEEGPVDGGPAEPSPRKRGPGASDDEEKVTMTEEEVSRIATLRSGHDVRAASFRQSEDNASETQSVLPAASTTQRIKPLEMPTSKGSDQANDAPGRTKMVRNHVRLLNHAGSGMHYAPRSLGGASERTVSYDVSGRRVDSSSLPAFATAKRLDPAYGIPVTEYTG